MTDYIKVYFRNDEVKKYERSEYESLTEDCSYMIDDEYIESIMYENENGDSHREDGPAYIAYYKDVITQECYYINGQQHRDGAPAVYTYDDDGNLEELEWWVNGEHIDSEYVEE